MMLYQEIRERCRMYHQNDSKYDAAYASYMLYRNKTQTKWDNPHSLDYEEIERLVRFLRQWECFRFKKTDDITPLLLNNMKSEVPLLNTLQSKTLLDVNFDEDAKQVIAKCFNGIAQIQNYESVATSKALHVAVNPDLFVMWDRAIQSEYLMETNNGRTYAREFLPWMQEIANQAVDEVMTKESRSRAAAIKSFTDNCEKKNSLAKIIDEYNFAKYTAKWRL